VFHTRCPKVIGDVCRRSLPRSIDVASGHSAACHLHEEAKGAA
jgi:hypothetical protein